MNRRQLILDIAWALLMIVLMGGCTRLAVREFDRLGDERCRSGAWSGEELCPAERTSPKGEKSTQNSLGGAPYDSRPQPVNRN